MKFVSLIIVLLLLVQSFFVQGWVVPVSESMINTACQNGGTNKLKDDCEHSSETTGYIRSKNSLLVCCPSTPVIPSTLKFLKVGDKARRYCTEDRSSARSDLYNKVMGGNLSEVAEFPHMTGESKTAV